MTYAVTARLRHTAQMFLALSGLMVAGCGDGADSPTTAPTPRIPSVVGNYTGSTTLSYPELGQSITCSVSTAVTQSGGTVSIAPLVLGGQCGNLSIPFGQVEIDQTGAFLGPTTTTVSQPCGIYNAAGSGGFFGRDLRISITASSRTCYNFNMTSVLTRL